MALQSSKGNLATMSRTTWGVLAFALCLGAAAAGDQQTNPATPAEQYRLLTQEFFDATHVLLNATTDDERNKSVATVDPLPLKLLELAQNHPRDPIALDALVQVVKQESWLERNTLHPGWGDDSRAARALAILTRDHAQSDKLAEACQRAGQGFRQEGETFLRTVLQKNPHHEMQALACLRLAEFLNGRLQRLDLLKGQPAMARRYEGLFGKEYLDKLQRQDIAKSLAEVETLFALAETRYGDVNLPFGGTVGAVVQSELYEIRTLAVGKPAPATEGADQNGTAFKLSDYRGKVVLLYFWQQFCLA
jgi:hypothetical protein